MRGSHSRQLAALLAVVPVLLASDTRARGSRSRLFRMLGNGLPALCASRSEYIARLGRLRGLQSVGLLSHPARR
jgi:hypothetical protein